MHTRNDVLCVAMRMTVHCVYRNTAEQQPPYTFRLNRADISNTHTLNHTHKYIEIHVLAQSIPYGARVTVHVYRRDMHWYWCCSVWKLISCVYFVCIIRKASVSIVQNRWYIVYIVPYHHIYFNYNYYHLSIA